MYEVANPDEYVLVKKVIEYPNPKVGRQETITWVQKGYLPRYEENVWVNLGGGYQTKGPKDEIMDTYTLPEGGDPYRALDWSRTSRYKRLEAQADDETLEYGWITPEGRVIRCHYHEHDSVAWMLLGGTVHEVEKTHIRVSKGKPMLWGHDEPTPAQIRTLRNVFGLKWDRRDPF